MFQVEPRTGFLHIILAAAIHLACGMALAGTPAPGGFDTDYSKLIAQKYGCRSDTCIINHLNKDYRAFRYEYPDSAFLLAKEALRLSGKAGYTKGLITAYYNVGDAFSAAGNMDTALLFLDSAMAGATESEDLMQQSDIINLQGIIYSDMGDYNKSIEYYNRARRIAASVNYKLGVASSLNNIGSSYYLKADYEKAISYYLKGYDLLEELNDSGRISTLLSNLAVFYDLNGQVDKALETNRKSLAYLKKTNLYSRANVLNNLGSLYIKKGNAGEGLSCYTQALELMLKVKDARGIAAAYNNVGYTYVNDEKYSMAIPYFEKAVQIAGEGGYRHDEAFYMKSLATCCFYHTDYRKAEQYALESLQSAKEMHVRDLVRDNYFLLADIYRKSKKFDKATEYMFLYKVLNDSIMDEEYQENISEMEVRYETEKVEKENLLLTKDQELRQAELQKQKIISWAVGGGFLLALALGFFILRGYMVKKKANIEITRQKEIIEEKNKDIMDSISYSKRLQDAILPTQARMEQHLKDTFVLYKPKDIVAGDFYWMHPMGEEVLFAAADCTGHGVPGAMLSMVCFNALNKSVGEFSLKKPAAILDKTRELVISTFEQGDEEVKDGMDIALCSLNFSSNTLCFAGAYNSLYHVGASGLTEIRADKQPIGVSDDPILYTHHELQLEKGDTVYIFSDGYIDQFGGPNGKKLKSKPFKELLMGMQGESMKRQKELLGEYFDQWRGSLEQVDDVCVIGVKR